MPRNIYLDLGANKGDTLAAFLADHPDFEAWGFEPNPTLLPVLADRFSDGSVTIVDAAIWTKTSRKRMFLGHPLSSTLVKGKRKMPEAPHFEITYEESVLVSTIDIATWLSENVSAEDYVIVKMDIEGAEYEVLQHLLDTNAIDLIDELRCEFHQNRFPISTQRDQKIKAAVEERTKLVPWQ